jgi:hypothetical protein
MRSKELTERMTYAVLNGPHGRELLDPQRYSVRKVRRIVEADCDYHRYGTLHRVTFFGTHGVVTCTECASHKAAQAFIKARCAVVVPASVVSCPELDEDSCNIMVSS